jgi:putative peptidoglycan lipid II flippase
MLLKVLASGYYARQNIKTPVKIAACAVVVNIVLNALLIVPLAHTGIALATSIAGVFNVGLLAAGLLRDGVWRPENTWWLFMLRLFIAGASLGLLLYFATPATDRWLHASLMWRVSHLSGLIAAGMGIYFSLLFVSGLRMRDLRL